MIDHPIQSRSELIDEIAEAMLSANDELTFVLDLTAGEVAFSPETNRLYGEDDVDRDDHDLEVILPPTSRESFEVRLEYAETRSDPKVRDRLLDALNGRKPFRRFKEALADMGWLDWGDYEEAAFRRFAEQWLADSRIDFQNGRIVRKNIEGADDEQRSLIRD